MSCVTRDSKLVTKNLDASYSCIASKTKWRDNSITRGYCKNCNKELNMSIKLNMLKDGRTDWRHRDVEGVLVPNGHTDVEGVLVKNWLRSDNKQKRGQNIFLLGRIKLKGDQDFEEADGLSVCDGNYLSGNCLGSVDCWIEK